MNNSKATLILTCLALGSLWGLSELILGNVFHSSFHHLKGGVFTGIGLGIIGISFALFKKPITGIGMALIVCAIKQLVVPILGLTVMCKANACIAVLLEAGTLSAILKFISNKREREITFARASITGGVAGLSASILFYFIGMRVAPCAYLLSFNHRFFNWLIYEGTLWLLFPAILFPVGLSAGKRVKNWIVTIINTKPAIYYRITIIITIICIGVSSLIIYNAQY